MAEQSELLQALYRGDYERAHELRLSLDRPLDGFEAAAVGDAEGLGELLASDPGLANARSGDGFTVLHLAAFFGGPAAVSTALASGCDPDAEAENDMRVRPLHSAVARGSHEIAGALLEAGADPDSQQAGGFTALHAAAMHGDPALVDLLLAHGADASIEDGDGRDAAAFARSAGHVELAARLRA